MIATVIIVVLVFSAVLGWMLLRAVKSAERSARDLRYRRRRLILFGLVYLAGATFGIVEVANGKQPIQSLAGLPVLLVMALILLLGARRSRVSPGRMAK